MTEIHLLKVFSDLAQRQPIVANGNVPDPRPSVKVQFMVRSGHPIVRFPWTQAPDPEPELFMRHRNEAAQMPVRSGARSGEPPSRIRPSVASRRSDAKRLRWTGQM